MPEVYLPSKYSDDLRYLVRYRRSLRESITIIKTKVHAILSSSSISIDATDIFGKNGMKCIMNSMDRISTAQRFVLSDLLDQITYLMKKESIIEDEISRMVKEHRTVNILMSVPGIGVYSSAAIMSEIDNISRFRSKEKLASYAGLVPRQNQSGSSDIRGHITKHGPSMLRFILVTAAHSVIKYSDRMRKKYLSIVRRTGKNRAIVAIARILIETIYSMLVNGKEFIDKIDELTQRKMVQMRTRSMRKTKIPEIEYIINDLMNVRRERQKRYGIERKINNGDGIT